MVLPGDDSDLLDDDAAAAAGWVPGLDEPTNDVVVVVGK
jgi:hypothetical protein